LTEHLGAETKNLMPISGRLVSDHLHGRCETSSRLPIQDVGRLFGTGKATS